MVSKEIERAALAVKLNTPIQNSSATKFSECPVSSGDFSELASLANSVTNDRTKQRVRTTKLR